VSFDINQKTVTLRIGHAHQIDLSIEAVQRALDKKPVRCVDIAPLMGVLSILKAIAEYKKPAPDGGKEERLLAKQQPCGCVICTCEDEIQCQGCGAKNCGTHPVGEIPNPVYATAPDGGKEGKQ